MSFGTPEKAFRIRPWKLLLACTTSELKSVSGDCEGDEILNPDNVYLRSGQSIALLEFQTAVEEIFDVQLLAGLRFPEVIGFQQETIQHTFIVPTGKCPPPRGGALTRQP
jgi:hypothetical protein